MSEKWFVSRQMYWGVSDADASVVEIAAGGRDFANADMLAPRYRGAGEGKEYSDPREALKAARAVCAAWQHDAPQAAADIHVEVGATGGMTLPFISHPT